MSKEELLKSIFKNDEEYKRFKKAKKNKDEILNFLKKEKIKYKSVEFSKLAGKFIKERRKELKISPIEIAKSLNISYRTYYKYENGQINIPLHTLFLITKNLNISFDLLIDKYYEEIYGANYRIFLKFSDVDLDKSIDIVKEIYKSGDKKLISALNNNLDIYYSLLKKG